MTQRNDHDSPRIKAANLKTVMDMERTKVRTFMFSESFFNQKNAASVLSAFFNYVVRKSKLR